MIKFFNVTAMHRAYIIHRESCEFIFSSQQLRSVCIIFTDRRYAIR